MVNETNTAGGWYCAYCQRGVDPSEVTFRETHEVCGRMIADDEPPAVDIATERDNLKQEVERLREAAWELVRTTDQYNEQLHAFKQAPHLMPRPNDERAISAFNSLRAALRTGG